jgi:hypothetical protein
LKLGPERSNVHAGRGRDGEDRRWCIGYREAAAQLQLARQRSGQADAHVRVRCKELEEALAVDLEQLAIADRLDGSRAARSRQDGEFADGRARAEHARDFLLPVASDDDTEPSRDDEEHRVS